MGRHWLTEAQKEDAFGPVLRIRFMLLVYLASGCFLLGVSYGACSLVGM